MSNPYPHTPWLLHSRKRFGQFGWRDGKHCLRTRVDDKPFLSNGKVVPPFQESAAAELAYLQFAEGAHVLRPYLEFDQPIDHRLFRLGSKPLLKLHDQKYSAPKNFGRDVQIIQEFLPFLDAWSSLLGSHGPIDDQECSAMAAYLRTQKGRKPLQPFLLQYGVATEVGEGVCNGRERKIAEGLYMGEHPAVGLG